MPEREELIFEVTARIRDEASQAAKQIEAALGRIQGLATIDPGRIRQAFDEAGRGADAYAVRVASAAERANQSLRSQLQVADSVRVALQRVEIPRIDLSNMQRGLELAQRRVEVATTEVRAERELADLLQRRVVLEQRLAQAQQTARTNIPTTLQQTLGRDLGQLQTQIVQQQAIVDAQQQLVPGGGGAPPPTLAPGGGGGGGVPASTWGFSRTGLRQARQVVTPLLATMAPGFAGPVFQTAQAAQLGMAIGGAAGFAVAGVGAAIAGAAAYFQAVQAAAEGQAQLNLAVKSLDTGGLRSQLGQAVGELAIFEERSKSAAGSLINAFSRAFTFLSGAPSPEERAQRAAMAFGQTFAEIDRPASIARGAIAGIEGRQAVLGTERARFEFELGMAGPEGLGAMERVGGSQVREAGMLDIARLEQERIILGTEQARAVAQIKAMADQLRGGDQGRAEEQRLREQIVREYPHLASQLPPKGDLTGLENVVETIASEYNARIGTIARQIEAAQRRQALEEEQFERAMSARRVAFTAAAQRNATMREDFAGFLTPEAEAALAAQQADRERAQDFRRGLEQRSIDFYGVADRVRGGVQPDTQAALEAAGFGSLSPAQLADVNRALAALAEQAKQTGEALEEVEKNAEAAAAARPGQLAEVADSELREVEYTFRRRQRGIAEFGAETRVLQAQGALTGRELAGRGLAAKSLGIAAEDERLVGYRKKYTGTSGLDVDELRRLQEQIEATQSRIKVLGGELAAATYENTQVFDWFEGLSAGIRDVGNSSEAWGDRVRGSVHQTAAAMSDAMTSSFFAVIEGKWKDLGKIGEVMGRTMVRSFVDALSQGAVANAYAALGQLFSPGSVRFR